MLLKDLLVQYRAAHNLSQRAFASKCGVTNGYISMLENGKNPATGKPVVPSLSRLSKIAAGMELSIQQLLQLADDTEIDIGGSDSIDLPTQKQSVIDALTETYNLTDLERDVIDAFLGMDPDQQKVFLEMARALKKNS